jgi:hypothetical protein
MGQIDIKNSHFTGPDGNRYFRRNSIELGIGKYGEKKTPITQANSLEVDGGISAALLEGKIRKSQPYEIDWSKESQADVTGSASLFFNLEGTADFTLNRAREAKLKLVRFHIEGADLATALNNDKGALAEMKREGNDARVCSSVWVVMSGELAHRFESSVRLSVSGNAGALQLGVEGGGAWKGEEKITLSAGTIFAYGLHKIDKWKGDLAGTMESDWHSFG